METLKELRKRHNLTQVQMAEIIGITSRSYREKESKKKPFTQIEMIKIISIFELDPFSTYEIFYKSCLSYMKFINLLTISEIKEKKLLGIK